MAIVALKNGPPVGHVPREIAMLLSPLMLHATAVAMMEVVDVTAFPIHAQCLAVFKGPAYILNQIQQIMALNQVAAQVY